MFIKDYLSLSSEDKSIVSQRRVEDERTPKHWIETFKKLAVIDREGDAVRKYSYWAGILGIVLIALTALGYFFGFGFFSIVFVLGLTLLVLGFSVYFISKRFDLPNELMTETINPILSLLHEDIKKDGKVRLKLDLRGFKQPDKADGEEDDYSHARHKITNYFYTDNWCEGETVLADGTELIWKISDVVRHRVKKKYGSSGKSKGKEIKNKHKSLISVRAGVDRNVFALPNRLKYKGDEGKISTRKMDRREWMSVERKIRHAEGEHFVPKYFIDAVAAVYMRAKPIGESK